MKSTARNLLPLLTALALAIPLTVQAQTTYRVTNLGTIGGTASGGNSINDISWVTGTSTIEPTDSVIHATLWAYGLQVDLKTLGGSNSAVLWPVHNNFGAISGVSETAEIDPYGEAWSCSAFFPPPATGHVCRGFVWQWGHMTELPTFGGKNGYAAGNNNRGQTVGWAETRNRDSTCAGTQIFQFVAAQWDPWTNTIHELPPLSGDPDSAATAINDEGQAVGISGLCDVAVGASTAEHMVIWNHGVPTQIPNLGGSDWNTPTDINDRGQVVGFSDLPGDSPENFNFHGFFWSRETGLIEIKPFAGDSLVEALGVNNRGQVVGESCTLSFDCRAFIWQNGKMADLNTLIPAGSPLYLVYANDINDLGEITGGALDATTGNTPAFLAVPDGAGNWDAGAIHVELTARPQLPQKMREAIARRTGIKVSQSK